MLAASEAQCVAISLDHAQLNTTSRELGVSVSVECEEGYELSGTPELTCEWPGIWSALLPYCKNYNQGGNDDQLMIIVICSLATLVALGVLGFAIYMLCCNMRSEKKAKQEQRDLEDIKELRIYQAVTQDCVGMPPVVYDNLHAPLRGRQSNSSESGSGSTTAPKFTESQLELEHQKAIIF